MVPCDAMPRAYGRAHPYGRLASGFELTSFCDAPRGALAQDVFAGGETVRTQKSICNGRTAEDPSAPRCRRRGRRLARPRYDAQTLHDIDPTTTQTWFTSHGFEHVLAFYSLHTHVLIHMWPIDESAHECSELLSPLRRGFV